MTQTQQTEQTPHRTWLITGATSGIGRALAEAALDAGENVVGTARRIERFTGWTEPHGDRFLPVAHDVRDTDAAAAVVAQGIERFGGIDVLVNNAGVGQVGAAEEVSDDQLRDMLAQHLFGPAALVRAVLPAMRATGRGAIVQVSSQGGRMSFPGAGSYSAGKFALEGWSEALAGEVRGFGIRVLIVEPSRFRTGFNDDDVLLNATESEAYDQVLGAVRTELRSVAGSQEGDPVRGAGIIREVLALPETPLRLPLGAEAVRNLAEAYRQGIAELDRTAAFAEAADFPDAPPSQRAFR
ncbi:SDR family NAD(P)-dependent oxidoreductase [Enemella evansiae]|uniref:Short-chain dehydrogenase/reductase n=1 Tax=Enemella evansiae TaxID=2016499 RepID=A0A255GE78_9ACTN|nr:SDR family NAD(P)-dependent oxidoreductase [Enemella evansiae]OYO12796.1 short-chain dehydrogenase/reductase [Enemella evansiae]OYO19166.1 short-chain dehydrogenase/reductase [Enemella evansiae]TDO91706.1 short-subunit dehydrogenase [Enemella evansiae]